MGVVVAGAVQPSGRQMQPVGNPAVNHSPPKLAAVQPSGQAVQPNGREGVAAKINPDGKLLVEALRR